MNRGDARRLWSKAAYGEHDAEVTAFLREVAKKMLDADRAPLKDRPGAVLTAAGLAGRDPQRRQSETFTLSMWIDGARRGEITEPAHEFMARLCYRHDDTDEALRAWIARIVAALPEPTRSEWDALLRKG